MVQAKHPVRGLELLKEERRGADLPGRVLVGIVRSRWRRRVDSDRKPRQVDALYHQH